MTIKIELSDETWLNVYEAFLLKRTPRAGIEAAINTLLEAMVKEGTARIVTRGTWSTELAPATQDTIIIHLGGKL